MIPDGLQHDRPRAVTLLQERGLRLGAAVWVCDARGAIVAEPDVEGGAGWLRAGRLRRKIEETVRRWAETPVPAVEALFPGAWALPLVHDDAVRRLAISLALVLEPAAAKSEEFRAICADASAEPDKVRDALAPLLRHGAEDAERLHHILSWTHSDLIIADEQSLTLDDYGRQLADVYEQINVLFTVAGSMGSLNNPLGLVTMTCNMLHRTLDFEWLAVRFSSLTELGRALANDLVLTGSIPCSHTRFDKLAGELTNAFASNRGADLLEPATSPLAELCGSEIIATPIVCDDRVAAVVLAGNKFGPDTEIDSADAQLIRATAECLGSFLHNSTMYNEQRTTFLGIIKALSASIDAKDRYTRGHSERVAHLASHLAQATGLSEDKVDRVRLAGLLHDMGKIGVPEAVLLKPGKLTPAEFDQIKMHPTIGYNILKDIEPLEDVLPGVLHHHERWDGSGYPKGLKGEAIPFIARLVAVADAFDAMSSNRSYRSALLRKRVLRDIRLAAGNQLDPALARRFVTLDLREYDRLVARHEAQDARAA